MIVETELGSYELKEGEVAIKIARVYKTGAVGKCQSLGYRIPKGIEQTLGINARDHFVLIVKSGEKELVLRFLKTK